ncbi:hypothetical protein DM02DRAFT_655509 [Periconia macrospinosa]|uniref:Uncharacterized protein n=1 Tax=Periconia macrospinosa TaxID=97972 RepID=A0A2V1DRC3_9PLEO|nr:hypothetical protein DM02DRAFT_655509 [Periconia macrospinosa]
MSYKLSIAVYGPGAIPEEPSHWAFVFHTTTSGPENTPPTTTASASTSTSTSTTTTPRRKTGNVLHIIHPDNNKNFYTFDKHEDHEFESNACKGYFTIATLTPEQAQRADKIIADEPVPKVGEENCQDWVLNATISLLMEQLVDEEACQRVDGVRGKSALEVAEVLGESWVRPAPRE